MTAGGYLGSVPGGRRRWSLPFGGAEGQLPVDGVDEFGNRDPSAREAIEAVTDRTAWTLNNSKGIRMAQGLSADIDTGDH